MLRASEAVRCLFYPNVPQILDLDCDPLGSTHLSLVLPTIPLDSMIGLRTGRWTSRSWNTAGPPWSVTKGWGKRVLWAGRVGEGPGR